VNGLAASSCTILFTFNQELTPELLQGLKLQLFDTGSTPWLEKQLELVDGRPDTAGVVINHPYFVAPPWYDVTYLFSLQTSTGPVVHQATANLHRWKPPLCWDLNYPNLTTGRCPLPQDQHPWDTWYGKPMPTGVPEE
jgi:hypothetical protein